MPTLKAIKEFGWALLSLPTYDPRSNPYTWFGFLWGLPVPLFSVGIDLFASGTEFSLSNAIERIVDHPIHLFFLAHPLLFAVVFGAMGSIRSYKDLQIQNLLEELNETVEGLKALDEAKTRFVSIISHELKTPLVTVAGYTDMLLDGHFGSLTDQQLKGLEVSRRNADRLLHLIENLLDIARIDREMMSISLATHDLRTIARHAVEGITPATLAKGIQIELLHGPKPMLVQVDSSRLGQVFENLLSNAVKFTDPGGEISVVLEWKGERVVEVTVRDTGCGIPNEAQERLFERFFQIDDSSTRSHSGVGLGLSIVRNILHLHGTEIEVDSTVGEGSAFSFELPIFSEDQSSNGTRKPASISAMP